MGFVSDFFTGPKSTASQEPLETPEQKRARQMMMDFATTGRFGQFQAGEDLGLPLGVFEPTSYERMGLGRLQNLLGSAPPEMLGLAGETLKDILNVSEPAFEKRISPFRAQVEREATEQESALRRGAAFGGNLYSTGTIRQLGDVRARAQESMQSKIAELYESDLARQLAAIPQAIGLGQTLENLEMGRIGASQTYGALPRLLETAGMQANFQEALRKRGELLQPLQAAMQISSTQIPWGVKEATYRGEAPFWNLLGSGLKAWGSSMGAPQMTPAPA